MRELGVNFEFSEIERKRVQEAFLGLSRNPYKDYWGFVQEVSGRLAVCPDRFLRFCDEFKRRDFAEEPFCFLQNCPIDPALPVFSNDTPVEEKRAKKKTFVAEAILTAYATLMDEKPIGYLNVNDGDVFQDIFPKESMKDTQSQKALGPIYFHKDLANHFVRPDWVNIVCLRSEPDNQIYTTFVRNVDVLSEFTDGEKELLRQPVFHTPFDDLTVLTGNVEVGEAGKHPIYTGDFDIRFFENRTTGLKAEATRMVQKVRDALHKHKRRVLMLPGDLVGSCNNHSVHSKEVHEVRYPERQRQRWLMKTVNVASLDVHTRHYVAGSRNIVNG